jgi:hypothetical protein
MVRVFREQLEDARALGGTAVAGLWWRTAIDLVRSAPGQYLQQEEPVPQPTEADHRYLAPAPRSRAGSLATLCAAMPLVLLVGLAAIAPGFLDPMFANPPAVLGLPAGMILLGLVVVLGVVGVAAVWHTSSPAVALIPIVLLSVPAIVLVILGPAMILIIQNLAT